MNVDPDTVAAERERLQAQAPDVARVINDVRTRLGELFDVEVERVDADQVRGAVDEVFADGDLAVNAATLSALLRDLDVEDDYPGFVVDELLARELAGMLAGQQPRRLLGEATFHYADIHVHEGETAGDDDLLAALAAGLQTRLPGWSWTDGSSPYD
jgi:hypothetical protein